MTDRKQLKTSKFNLTTLSFSSWGKHLWSLDRLAELDELEEEIKECLRKAFKDDNDFEFDDSSEYSNIRMSDSNDSSEIRVSPVSINSKIRVR